MIVKNTYSKGGVWKPSTSEKEKYLADAGEFSTLKLSAGTGGSTVYLYDAKTSANATENNLKWVLDCSAASNDINIFSSPLLFEKGVYAVCKTGWQYNPIVSLAKIGNS